MRTGLFPEETINYSSLITTFTVIAAMQIDIKATNLELTDAIRSHVENKMNDLNAITARFGEVVRAEVEVGKTSRHHQKGDIFRAEVHVRLPGKLIYVEAAHDDLYVAINDAQKEAQRQILAYKGILDAGQKRGGRAAKRAVRGEDKMKGGRTLEEGV